MRCYPEVMVFYPTCTDCITPLISPEGSERSILKTAAIEPSYDKPLESGPVPRNATIVELHGLIVRVQAIRQGANVHHWLPTTSARHRHSRHLRQRLLASTPNQLYVQPSNRARHSIELNLEKYLWKHRMDCLLIRCTFGVEYGLNIANVGTGTGDGRNIESPTRICIL
jgi:hypothetical protein